MEGQGFRQPADAGNVGANTSSPALSGATIVTDGALLSWTSADVARLHVVHWLRAAGFPQSSLL
jgi:hypothetical protein